MNGQLIAVQPRNFVTVLALALLLITGGALAQVPVDENGNPIGTWSGESERSGQAADPGDTSFSTTELADLVGPRASLIEYGSGSSRKTRVLLEHLHEQAAYVPVYISEDHLIT